MIDTLDAVGIVVLPVKAVCYGCGKDYIVFEGVLWFFFFDPY